MRNSILSLAILLLFATSSAKGAQGLSLPEGSLPLAWTVQRRVDLPSSQLPALSERLNGTITSLRQIWIDGGGLSLRVHRLTCKSDRDGAAVLAALQRMGHGPTTLAREGPVVVEFIASSLQALKKLRHLLGLDRRSSAWSLAVTVTPLIDGDWRSWNNLFNSLMTLERGSAGKLDRERILSLASRFEIGTSLPLCSPQEVGERYRFIPPPANFRSVGDTTIYEFKDLPRRFELPRVQLQARLVTRGFAPRVPSAPVDKTSLTGPTPAWPVKAPALKAHWKGIDGLLPHRKAETLLATVRKVLSYGGPVGSRHGVLTALKGGRGRCWDFSDLYVTLCRSAGLPARQVYGWLHGVSGHVWTEVLLQGKWIAVDPTTTWLGVSSDYLPLVLSEDGRMPLVYWNLPEIKRVKSE